MVFSFIHSANLIPFVVVLYFHGGRSTTSISPSSSVLNNASESDVSTSLMTFTTTGYQAPPSISKTTTLTSSVSATVTPTKKTIVNFTCILLKPWNDTLHNTSSGDYIKLKKEVKDALEKLYSDSKYDLEKSSIVVSFTKRGKDVTINAVVTFGNGITAQSVEDDFLDSVEKETLDIEKISKEDARATPIGVDFEWKADDGECERACSDSETSTGQSFKLKRTCTDGANSCKGLNKKKETTDCKEYCASSVASHLSFPLSGLVIALLAPMSLQL